MYKLFPVVTLVVLCGISFAGYAATSSNCGKNVVSNLPQCVADAVYQGKDADMPPSDGYQMALQPLRGEDGDIAIPETFADMLRYMHAVLPNWYQNALRESHGRYDCDVQVNGQSYAILTADWLWVEWKLDSNGSPLRNQFSKVGLDSQTEIQQAIVFGFCEYVKSGEQKALETIAARGAAVRKRSDGGN